VSGKHGNGFVMILHVQAESQRFNMAWGTREADAPLVEFLLAAAQGAQQLYTSFFQQITDQVVPPPPPASSWCGKGESSRSMNRIYSG